MIHQLTIGIAIIVVTIIVQALFMATATRVLVQAGAWLYRPPFLIKNAFALAGITSWLVIAMSIEVAIWAISFQLVEAFDAFEPSLYFSIVTFTTLGYGDIIPDADWRLLAGLTAADGLIIFGLNTAFLVEFVTRVQKVQNAK